MQYEFDQLLEDLWDGRLDEAGRQRLDALCAANPRLAARYRQERNLTGLLSRCGPNHAPDDLARSVMARLETRVRVRPLRPWYWWMMQPAFRTAFAAVVLVAVGVEIGLLVAQKKETQLAYAPLHATPMTITINKPLPEVPTDDTSPAPARVEPQRIPQTKPAKTVHERSVDVAMLPKPERTVVPPQTNYQVEPFPTPAPAAPGQPLAGTVTEFPTGNQLTGGAAVVPTPAPTATPQSQFPAVPGADSQLAKGQSAEGKTRKAPLGIADREVAMRITLNPNDLPLRSSADADNPVSTLPPGATSFVQPSDAKPRQEPLTHKDVETALFAVPGVTENDVHYGPVPGEPRKWQVLARLTQVQFLSFIAELRKTGIRPSPSVTASTPKEAEELRNQPPSRTRNLYDITQGRQWMQPLIKPRVSMVPATQLVGTTATVKTTVGRTESGSAEKLDVKIIIEQVDGMLSAH